eukprot:868179-Prymnesium_polylepis.1
MHDARSSLVPRAAGWAAASAVPRRAAMAAATGGSRGGGHGRRGSGNRSTMYRWAGGLLSPPYTTLAR